VSLALTEEHLALAATARRWLETHTPVAAARAVLETETDTRPGWWLDLVALGWLGLAMAEEHGGQGYGISELAVVLEQTGRVALPGPLLPTVIAATAIARWAPDPSSVHALVDGTSTAGFALDSELVAARSSGAEDGLVVSGSVPAVWAGAIADVLLLPVARDGERRWCAVDRRDVVMTGRPSFDPTRRLSAAHLDAVTIPESRCLQQGAPVAEVAAVLASAEALGVSQWCVEAAAEHARTRVQFGRPIGQFQAVKHRVAEMLVALEAARAAVWDAARTFDDDDDGDGDNDVDDQALPAGAAVAFGAGSALGPEAAFRCAKDCVQVLGGIGYTWEHDAHIFLKRATAMRHLLPQPAVARRAVAKAVIAGERRALTVDLPPEAEPVRERTSAFVAQLVARPKPEWTGVLADSGYLVPHWPRPWGLDAGPIEQLVIDQELAAAHVRRPHLQIAGWVLPTIINHGTSEQQERWVPGSLRGEIHWCQMFSEPDAGSDLASLTTRAVQVDGGWSITGQKVWTTMAREADWAICLARTDPAVPRHEGIGCFLVDMATPGIDIRPLRELTGVAMFNEVFLSDVFVPDDCVVGAPTAGWECARTTLANERVSMASGSSFGPGVAALFDLAERRGSSSEPLVVDQLGGLAIDAHAIAMLGMRITLRALAGGLPGPEASVRKLLGVHHEQDVQEAGLDLLGPDAAITAGEGAAWTAGFLGNRALSIAGGTSEIQKNVIAERLLGLPKDP